MLESRDGAVVNRAARQILAKQADEKLFLHLHYMDVHAPYTGRERKPPPYRFRGAGATADASSAWR